MKVLVGEDDTAIADVMRIILEGEGHTVLAVTEGKIVLADTLTHQPDVILLDISLGGSNGAEVTKSLKKDSQTRHIPIIIASANQDTENIAKKAGADGFLLKPFELDALIAVVNRYQKVK